MLRRLKNQKGFTLIELMIVVAIIGILSAIAIPNFITFRMKAKTAEAKSNLGSIRTCEESYRAENDVYFAVARYPSAAATGSPDVWLITSTGFSSIGFAPSGRIYYDYAVDGIGANTYTAHAYGDLDDDDVEADYQVTPNTNITNVPGNKIY